ncbi:MAG: hypothetical protein HYT15_02145 [Candidatus Magasanikbacteria bacterium]|nr:hypothetical protein [Candidatus Magasanikbacteria bacterium]
MGRTNQTIKILGTTGFLSCSYGRDPQWSTMIEIDDPEELDWQDIPPELKFEGKKLIVCVKIGSRSNHAFTSAELRQIGQELRWTKNNPLGAQLKELRERRDFLKQQYDQDKAGNSSRLLLTFRKGGPRNELQASDETEPGRRFHRVFVLDRYTLERGNVKEGATYSCSIKQVLKQNDPQGNFQGFMLLLVSVGHEHFDPDQRIQKFEAAIAAGAK